MELHVLPAWAVCFLATLSPSFAQAPAAQRPSIDALVFALLLSFLVAAVVALKTKPMAEGHIRKCFGGPGRQLPEDVGLRRWICSDCH